MHRRRFLQLVGIVPPALVFATACSSAQSGVTVKLDHGPPAALGGTMTFMLTVTSTWDAPNLDPNGTKVTGAEVGFLLTDGLELLTADYSGQVLRPGTTSYSRQVTLKARQSQVFEIGVRLNIIGTHTVYSHASILINQLPTDSDKAGFYLKVDFNGTRVQREPFPEQAVPATPSAS